MSYISFSHVLYDFARTFIEIVTNQVLGHFKKNSIRLPELSGNKS